MASVCVIFWAFLFFIVVSRVYYILGAFLINKTIIPLALVGYEMIIANSARHWLSIISCPTRAHGIIVKYRFPILRTHAITEQFAQSFATLLKRGSTVY